MSFYGSRTDDFSKLRNTRPQALGVQEKEATSDSEKCDTRVAICSSLGGVTSTQEETRRY